MQKLITNSYKRGRKMNSILIDTLLAKLTLTKQTKMSVITYALFFPEAKRMIHAAHLKKVYASILKRFKRALLSI